MAVNLSKMTKADLIKLLQEKETKIEKLKTENEVLSTEKTQQGQSPPTASNQSSSTRSKTRSQTKTNNTAQTNPVQNDSPQKDFDGGPLEDSVFKKILEVFNEYGFDDNQLREKVTIEQLVKQLKPLPRKEVYQKLCDVIAHNSFYYGEGTVRSDLQYFFREMFDSFKIKWAPPGLTIPFPTYTKKLIADRSINSII